MALSNAERQAAYRARKQAELDEVVAAAVVFEEAVLTESPPRALPISEDEYVKLCLSAPDLIDEARAERYARWRYQGVLAGRVAGL